MFTEGNCYNAILSTEISFEGEITNLVDLKLSKANNRFTLNINKDSASYKVAYWSPEQPSLYDIKFILKKENNILDEVISYFGMRKISIKDGYIYLNNLKYYQKLILDQGYYGDGILTAKSEDIFIEDIKKIKAMGFNGLRKHQKVEDKRFIYWCDKLGLLVWAEMPSPYEFNDISIENLFYSWSEAIKQQYNHPSIIVWTIMNESWGINEVFSNKKQ